MIQKDPSVKTLLYDEEVKQKTNYVKITNATKIFENNSDTHNIK